MAAKTTRSERILLRCTPAEKLRIQELAGFEGVSEYIRRRALNLESAGEAREIGRLPAEPGSLPVSGRIRLEEIERSDRKQVEQRIERENPGLPANSLRVLVARELQRSG